MSLVTPHSMFPATDPGGTSKMGRAMLGSGEQKPLPGVRQKDRRWIWAEGWSGREGTGPQKGQKLQIHQQAREALHLFTMQIPGPWAPT